MAPHTSSKQKVRVGKYLKELVVVTDDGGAVVHKFLKPLMVEFYPRDIMQVCLGAILLSVPVGFTEEVWVLATQLAPWRVATIALASIGLIGLFVYFNIYKGHLAEHWGDLVKRTLLTYLFAVSVSFLFLFLIERIDGIDWISIKMVVLTALPASMSGTVADLVK